MNTVVPGCCDVRKSVISENRNTSVKLVSASPQKFRIASKVPHRLKIFASPKKLLRKKHP